MCLNKKNYFQLKSLTEKENVKPLQFFNTILNDFNIRKTLFCVNEKYQ